ncbi:DMT family transporter [Geovibrio thiophilus]|uniref:DMT family transporter n=1 Tax=Geovibrio thiophilus TaxID=139438 RepID=A0A3R5V030_9BACT|nr:DMT family transporter [Geovibrio thiophilus]QAR33917.1 DMT family transporter [Geovibrio thiophilus]
MDENFQPAEKAGIIYMLLASAFFASMGYYVKVLGQTLGTGEIVFFRNLIGLVIIVPMIIARPSGAKGGKPVMLAMRGVFGFLALFFYFYSISVLPLGTAATLTKIDPIFTALLAFFILKEKQGIMIWVGLLTGFVGVVMLMHPESGGVNAGSLSALLSGLFAAAAYTTVRNLREYYSPRAIVASFATAGVIGPPMVYAAVYYTPLGNDALRGLFHRMPSGAYEWYCIVMVGILATVSQYFLTKAYSLARASVAASVSYSGLLFASVAGVMAGDKLPDFMGICGILFIVLSGMTVHFSQKRRN